MLGDGHTYWDVIEFKFIVLVVTIFLAICVGNWLHNKSKDKG